MVMSHKYEMLRRHVHTVAPSWHYTTEMVGALNRKSNAFRRRIVRYMWYEPPSYLWYQPLAYKKATFDELFRKFVIGMFGVYFGALMSLTEKSFAERELVIFFSDNPLRREESVAVFVDENNQQWIVRTQNPSI